MSKLVDESLEYFYNNINEVLKLPIDMWCINDWLIKKLSDLVPVEVIDVMKDKGDKLQSRLYLQKLLTLFS